MTKQKKIDVLVRTLFPTREVCDGEHGQGEEGSECEEASNYLTKRTSEDGNIVSYWVGDRKAVWINEIASLEWYGMKSRDDLTLIGVRAAKDYLDSHYYFIASLTQSRSLRDRKAAWCKKKGREDIAYLKQKRDYLSNILELLEDGPPPDEQTDVTPDAPVEPPSKKRSRVDAPPLTRQQKNDKKMCDITWNLIDTIDNRLQSNPRAERSRFKLQEMLALRDLQGSVKLALAEYNKSAPILQETVSKGSAASNSNTSATATSGASAALVALAASAPSAGTGQHVIANAPAQASAVPVLPDDMALAPVTETSEKCRHLFEGFAVLVKGLMSQSLVSQDETAETYDKLIDLGMAGGIERNLVAKALGTKGGFDVIQSPEIKLVRSSVITAKRLKSLKDGPVNTSRNMAPVPRCCSVCERSGLELRQVDSKWKTSSSPLFCAHCVSRLEMDQNVLCTFRGCVCSHRTGTSLCRVHRDNTNVIDGRTLFDKRDFSGLSTGVFYSMCKTCRDKVSNNVKAARIERIKRKADWTDDERICFPRRFPGYSLPVLSFSAIEAVTMLANELQPAEWCRTYTLLCEWEREEGLFPSTMSKLTGAWWGHHTQFIRNNPLLTARRGTKEVAYPQYLTLRLLGTLSKLKATHKPVFAVPEQPTVEEWLTLLSYDKHQRKGLKTEQALVYVVRCIMRGELSGTSPLLCEKVIDLSGHRCFKFPVVRAKLIKAGFDMSILI